MRGTSSLFVRLRSSAASARAVPRVAALRDRLAAEQATLHDFVSPSSPPTVGSISSTRPATLRSAASSYLAGDAVAPLEQQQQQPPPSRRPSRRRHAPASVQEEPPNPMLVDNFARHHTYLRMSLTERCSLRYTACRRRGSTSRHRRSYSAPTRPCGSRASSLPV